QLACDDDVEARVRDLEGLIEVGPVGLDPEPGGRGERLAVGVEADDLVPVEVRPRQRAVAAAEIEHAPTRPADVALEQGLALGAGEPEAGTAPVAVVPG